MAANNAQIWTDRGLCWMESIIEKLATVNENVALVVLSAFQLVDSLDEPLRGRVRTILESLASHISPTQAPSLHGRLVQMLGR